MLVERLRCNRQGRKATLCVWEDRVYSFVYIGRQSVLLCVYEKTECNCFVCMGRQGVLLCVHGKTGCIALCT